MARYRATTRTFIAPQMIEQGQEFTISDDWVPGPHVEAVDDAAEKALAAYFKANPQASLRPVDALPITVDEVHAPKAPPAEVPNLADPSAKPEPGLANGGVAKAAK